MMQISHLKEINRSQYINNKQALEIERDLSEKQIGAANRVNNILTVLFVLAVVVLILWLTGVFGKSPIRMEEEDEEEYQ